MMQMFDATSPCNESEAAAAAGLQRTRGHGRCEFKIRDGQTVLAALKQSGAVKVRLPAVTAAGAPEAVLLNTAGGLTGGDALAFEGSVAAGGHAVFTTQACERAYRSVSGPAVVSVNLTAGPGARIDWLPQETIVFDGGNLTRTFDVQLRGDATLLAHESVVFGRTAMGETVRHGRFSDRWHVHRDGRLIHADAVRVSGAVDAVLGRPAVLGGACAMATVLLIGPGAEALAEDVRDVAHAVPPECGLAGVSAWNGKLVVRALGTDGRALRGIVEPIVKSLLAGRGLPRVWTT